MILRWYNINQSKIGCSNVIVYIVFHCSVYSLPRLPYYSHFYRRGRIKFASDKMLKILSGLVCSIKDARDLGYQIGFSHSTVEKYLARADSSAGSVSSSGFREMLRDWRRRVRPSEQVKELRLALEETGLSYEAEVLFNES